MKSMVHYTLEIGRGQLQDAVLTGETAAAYAVTQAQSSRIHQTPRRKSGQLGASRWSIFPSHASADFGQARVRHGVGKLIEAPGARDTSKEALRPRGVIEIQEPRWMSLRI